jgi:hypothetical protein
MPLPSRNMLRLDDSDGQYTYALLGSYVRSRHPTCQTGRYGPDCRGFGCDCKSALRSNGDPLRRQPAPVVCPVHALPQVPVKHYFCCARIRTRNSFKKYKYPADSLTDIDIATVTQAVTVLWCQAVCRFFSDDFRGFGFPWFPPDCLFKDASHCTADAAFV